ncbi:Ergic3 protein [Capsaspora owczarzaki ATCC 30864]|nr:Ergic3 protein [Capsaspora owczarzaki ATCC 30864]|eukprot:XP_004364824.1 Ergic3 protein [Capsaspora owczarzaki ATCC 30864]
MLSKSVLGRLKQLDAYAKTTEDVRIKTYGGAIVSIVCALIMAALFVSELNYFLTTETHHELLVDTTRAGEQKLRININVTFPRLPCAYMSIDVMDVAGEHQLDVLHTLVKTRLSASGEVVREPTPVEALGQQPPSDAAERRDLDNSKCGDCYGAQTEKRPCCNSCEEVQAAYREKGWGMMDPDSIEQCRQEGFSERMRSIANEGCKVQGFMYVNKVAGNFHFAPGKSSQHQHVHVHDLQQFKTTTFDMTHTIHLLSFGTEYPGQVNPLDAVSKVPPENTPGSAMFQYFIKVVPTEYVKLNGETEQTSQFSATSHVKMINHAAGENGLPGVFFMYEPSPMLVKITERRKSFMHFLTGVCAIVGGVFTVAGLVDATIYHSYRSIKKKMELGKQT